MLPPRPRPTAAFVALARVPACGLALWLVAHSSPVLAQGAAPAPAAPAAAAAPAAKVVGDARRGRIRANTCMGCHGIPHYTNAYPTYRVPMLGGQNPEYIVAALKEYQSGDRWHPTMHAQASSMTEQDMADLAAFLSKAPRHR